MKIEQALVLYLLKYKEISLQGIGIFKINSSVPDTSDSDKVVVIPPEAISFEYNPKIKEDDVLIDFIVQNTKKIKPLASADLDSFLTLGRQFLNIGKPFTIQNLGTLEKLKSGELDFKPGPLVQKVEVPKPKIEDEGAEKHEENLFNDYQKDTRSNHGRTLLYIGILVFLGIAAWATWRYGFKKDETAPAPNTDAIVPLRDTVVSAANQKADSASAAAKAADSLKKAQINGADTFSFKIVLKVTTDKQAALARLARLKSYGRNVIMYTQDSITYKVAELFTLPLADTTRVLDSLNKFYYRGKARLETK